MDIIDFVFLAVIGLLMSCIAIFFRAYHKAKGNNRALLEDTARIEKEKQKIIYEFGIESEKNKQKHAREIEDLKQQNAEKLDQQKRAHDVDIQKRKYKYESKCREYYAAMDELDEFRGLNIEIIEKELGPMISACFASDLGISNNLFVDANEKAIKIIGDVRAQEAKLFSQLNGLKLSATKEILDIIEQLRETTTQSKYYLEEIISYVFSPEFRHTKSIPEKIQSKSAGLNERTTHLNKKLLIALRTDLDQL